MMKIEEEIPTRLSCESPFAGPYPHIQRWHNQQSRSQQHLSLFHWLAAPRNDVVRPDPWIECYLSLCVSTTHRRCNNWTMQVEVLDIRAPYL